MTEPVLKKGASAMRGDDPRCKVHAPDPHGSRQWDSAQTCLEWAYQCREASRSPRSPSLGSLTGGARGDGLLSLSILASVHRTLKSDHLILTIGVMYGDDPEELCGLVDLLASWSRCSRGKALGEIEDFQVSHTVSDRPSSPARTLSGWYALALGSLEDAFRERGWVRS